VHKSKCQGPAFLLQIRAVGYALSRQDGLPNRIMNVGGPDRLSLHEMALELAKVGGGGGVPR
jgi:hypothetical protein